MNDYAYDDAPTNVQGPQTPPPGRPLSQDQKSAIAAALAGTAALGGAAYGMSQYLDDESGNDVAVEDDGADKPTEPTPPVTDKIDSGLGSDGLAANASLADISVQPVVHVSEQDRNDMTFEEAFRDARQEMGKGHYFEWHGQLYNTFYLDEWEGMSPDEHQSFLASVYGPDAPGVGQGSMVAGGEIPAHTDKVAQDDPDILIDDAADEAVADVTVDEADHEGPASFPKDADVALAQLDGEQVSVFDTNHDDKPDAILKDGNVILIDTDHDHILDTQAIYDPTSHQLTDVHTLDDQLSIDGSMEILHDGTSHSGSALADEDFGADFDNNADITDYVA